MPRSKPEITSDFPIGDVKGTIENDDALEVTFIRRYKGGFYKTDPAYMSAQQFKKAIIKTLGYQPHWNEWSQDFVNVNGKMIAVEDDNHKPKKSWKAITTPEQVNTGQVQVQ